MQPLSNRKLAPEEFRRIVQRAAMERSMAASLEADPGFALPLPAEVGFQLTNRCNLRCRQCFQWGDDGFHSSFAAELLRNDLDIEIVARVLTETDSVASPIYLWG